MDASRETVDDSSTLENAADLAFQHREWRAQRIGRGLLGLLVGAACLGLLGGRGPLNATVRQARDGSLSVQYERFVRVGAPTSVRVTAHRAGSSTCRVSRSFLDAVVVERIEPAPVAVVVETDAVRFSFDRPIGAGGSLTFDVVPRAAGRLSGWVALARQPIVDLAPLAYF